PRGEAGSRPGERGRLVKPRWKGGQGDVGHAGAAARTGTAGGTRLGTGRRPSAQGRCACREGRRASRAQGPVGEAAGEAAGEAGAAKWDGRALGPGDVRATRARYLGHKHGG